MNSNIGYYVSSLPQILAFRNRLSSLTLVDGCVDGGEKATHRGVDWAAVREHAAAALLQLSHHNIRFKTQALQAGALEPLAALQESGTQRAKDKAATLLNILKQSPSEDQYGDEGEVLYGRALYRRGDRGSNNRSTVSKFDSAQF